jgi:ABC-type Mn2+/Zn2+ transport system ATPase subunit
VSSVPAIDTHGLVVGYNSRPVVADITLTLASGKSLALVGTNGSGKSTLLKTLVGLLPAVGGSVSIFGNDVDSEMKRVAYLGQFHNANKLLPLQARDVVMMGRYAGLGLLGRITTADRKVVERSLDRLGIGDLASKPLRSLSGGQQQRVYLAQVLAKEADLIVLDEPTAGLDAAGSQRYLDLVSEELRRGATVVTATHDISEALTCDHAVLLAGRVVASGQPSEVLTAERLLDAFGVALLAVPHAGHNDLVIAEAPHAHNH